MNNEDNLKLVVGRKKRNKKNKNKSLNNFNHIQVPGSSYVNFETCGSANSDQINLSKEVVQVEKPKPLNPEGTIQTIVPRKRGDPIKKEKFLTRNIHTIMDNLQTNPNKVPIAIPTQVPGSNVFYNNLNLNQSVNAIGVQSRPKGIPLTFLANRQNLGAIQPQTGMLRPTTNQVPPQMLPPQFNNPQFMTPPYIMPQNIPQQISLPNFVTQNMEPQPLNPNFPIHNIPHPMTIINPNESQYNTMGHSYSQVQSQPMHQYNQPSPVFDDDLNKSPKEQYSPTDVYSNDGSNRDSESPDVLENKQKRLSAFERLGPQTQPKKPKLTINLSFNKDQDKREVIEPVKYIPVYEREEVLNSSDPTVTKYRAYWPWKNTIPLKKVVTARSSKTVMMMEKEQVEEEYNNNSAFCIVSVKGFPHSWTKENVLDVLLENLKGTSFIPCFIEFTTLECKFLVNKCRQALLVFHNLGFSIRKGDVELMIKISVSLLNTNQLGFIPRLVLRNRLNMCYDSELKVDLKEFTLGEDVSNFIYFPLNRIANQTELLELLNMKNWNKIQELDLSYNRLTSLEGLDLLNNMPHLKVLNLSFNLLESIKVLMPCRGLMLRSLLLEGNPLCMNYVEGEYYLKVARTLFPSLRELDGVEIHLKGDMPKFKRHYSVKEATSIVEKFVEVFFRLLERDPEDRIELADIYHQNATLSITCRKKLHNTLFLRSSCSDDAATEIIDGPEKIIKLFKRWPKIQHDKNSFTVDVMLHDNTTTLLRIGGMLKITSTSLAEDEHLIAFTRTVLLFNDEVEYKICNEMIYWDEPTVEYAKSAFNLINLVQNKTTITLNFDTPLDDETKDSLINIFMNLTELDWKSSQRCLEEKNWDLKVALEYFTKYLKLDNIEFLKVPT